MTWVQEQRPVSGFDKVHLEGAGNVSLAQGDQDQLIIEAESSILPKLRSEVEDGCLELGFKHWTDYILMADPPKIHYIITMRQVHGISISGSANVESSPVNTDQLALKVSGAGNIQIPALTTQQLNTSFSGSGKASLAGKADQIDIRISGSGSLNAEELSSQDTQVHISGSGDVRLAVAHQLAVHISGTGSVRYHGAPMIKQHISGAGSVRPIE
jgi:hypothetical protein